MAHRHVALAGAIGALVTIGLAPDADASFIFVQVSNNGNTPVAQQFWLDVVDRSDLGVGVVGLKFSNTGPIASTIAEFHVDDGSDLFSGYFGGNAEGSTAYGNGAGVSMGPPPPGNGNFADAPNPWTTDFFATANASPAVNGVDPGEMFELRLVLDAGKTFNDALLATSAGILRVGVHAISIDDAGSESFVTNGQLPTPGAVSLAGLAFGLGFSRRRRTG